MNKTEFLSFIEHPENIGNVSLTESEKVLSKFPYWQSARLIFVKGLQQQQHFSYDSQLKLAAIYAGNRSKLFELINKNVEVAVSEGESGISDMGHPERSRRSGEGDPGISQLAVDNIKTEIDLTAIEKADEVFKDEETTIQEPIETPFENIISIESSIFESIEVLTDEKEEDVHESENDLSKIIEQRIKELTDQNSSYSEIENQDLIIEDNFENKSSLTDESIPTEIENNVSEKNSFEDETVSIEEEMAAIDVYEETTIADDIFNNTNAEIVSASEIIEEIVNEPNDDAKKDSSQHSFLEWLTLLKTSESKSKGESSSSSSSDSNQGGHPERSRRSAEGDGGSSSHQLAVGNPKNETETEDEKQIEESSTTNVVSEESSTNEDGPTGRSGIAHTSYENVETRNPKPETLNLIDKFIEEDPRIQPKKNAFFSPSVAARKSVVYDEEVVSETLAEIFYKQQLYDKALKAYEKLTLMFPEKSTLFAPRIKKIKEESKSGK